MKRPMLRVLTLFTVLLATTGARAQAPEGRVYAPGPFEQVQVDGSANLKLTQGERDEIFIAGDAELQRSVEVNVVGNRLLINTAGGWKFWDHSRVQVDVRLRRLSELTVSGASDVQAPGPIKTERLRIGISGAAQVRFDDLHAGQLKFDVSGAGDGQVAGEVGELSLSISGKGKFLAGQLRAARASVSISGVGNANLWVTNTLKVNISGVGNVEYWGQPEVTRSTSGLGSVNSRGDRR